MSTRTPFAQSRRAERVLRAAGEPVLAGRLFRVRVLPWAVMLLLGYMACPARHSL
ncbi:hypothetical protein ACFWXA_00735 [Streptomyces atroolivaceus]|uniref:Uncharacterized protein n=1 Tax=Streptomyces atroolivaceus TaxID=66869 RepID=A0ABV9V6I2_STRAZ